MFLPILLEAFLNRESKYDFGDYLRYQIDQQMYPFLGQLNNVMDGTLDPEAVDSYQHWMSDPDQAALYSNAQHSGSLGPGRTIAKTVDLTGAKNLLDVGGGTGATAADLRKTCGRRLSRSAGCHATTEWCGANAEAMRNPRWRILMIYVC